MMRDVVLGDHFERFVDDQITSGRYRDAEEVMRAALRLLEDREARLDALRAALVEGENSGAPTPFDFDAFIAHETERTSSRE